MVDNISLVVKAGDGGNGMVSFMKRGRKNTGGPDGGNGGNGGNIYFQGSNNVNDLRQFRFRKIITSENGVSGKRKNLFGKNAPHITIYLPLGTHITDTGKVLEVTNTVDLILAVQGGIGGRGNTEFKSATTQAPRYAEEGTLGEEKKLLLELNLIADIGLIGLPNTGKSSLLAVLTHATPKIGNYPFTTLEPNIGMLGKYTIADIPGLIKGASAGRGLGIAFLKHIEKVSLLFHCLSCELKEPEISYQQIRNELKSYNPKLLEIPEIILLTKTDLKSEQEVKLSLKALKKLKKQILPVSIHNFNSLKKLKNFILRSSLSL